MTTTIESIMDSRAISMEESLPPMPTQRVTSAPIIPPKIAESVEIKTQISAPSYLMSLKDHDAPPFKEAGSQYRPRVLINAIMNEAEVIEMVSVAESERNGLRRFFARFLVDKKIVETYNLSEKDFLISLMAEQIDYAAKRDFSAFKLSVFLTIYLDTHLYFKLYYWTAPLTIWLYFKETMIRHTIEDSPDGKEVFEPEESYDILSHFHTVYMSNLPLVHLATFRAYRLRFTWPFKANLFHVK